MKNFNESPSMSRIMKYEGIFGENESAEENMDATSENISMQLCLG